MSGYPGVEFIPITLAAAAARRAGVSRKNGRATLLIRRVHFRGSRAQISEAWSGPRAALVQVVGQLLRIDHLEDEKCKC